MCVAREKSSRFEEVCHVGTRDLFSYIVLSIVLSCLVRCFDLLELLPVKRERG